MKIWQHLKRPPWRTLLLLIAILGVIGLAYLLWSPGKTVRDGRHDLRSNGIWLQHGWLGDDLWFQRNQRDKSLFREDKKIQKLAILLEDHGIKYVFPHICPCNPSGRIAPVDPAQTERFLDCFSGFKVLPWVGGVLDAHCSPESPQWRTNFVSSVVDLVQAHPRLAGVQVNIEPMPSGNTDFLILLDELRRAMPEGKLISVAAYPPPTRWHPFPDVHWDEAYFREVARRADQLVPMMYDTAIKPPKVYQQLMATWTHEVLEWAEGTQVLLGLPVYDDADVGYHFPEAENLVSALRGIHAGLSKYETLPTSYAGVAIYCEWEMDQQEWTYFEKEFEKESFPISKLAKYCTGEDDMWQLTSKFPTMRLYFAMRLITSLGSEGLPFATNLLFRGGIEDLFANHEKTNEVPYMVESHKRMLAMKIAVAEPEGASPLLKSYFYAGMTDDEIASMGSVTQAIHIARFLEASGAAVEPAKTITFEEGENVCRIRLRLGEGTMILKKFQDNGIDFWVPLQNSPGYHAQWITKATTDTAITVVYKDSGGKTVDTINFSTYRLPPPGNPLHLTPSNIGRKDRDYVFDATQKGYSVEDIQNIVSNLHQRAAIGWGDQGIAYSLDVNLSSSNEICIVVRYDAPKTNKERTYMEGNIIHNASSVQAQIRDAAGKIRGVDYHAMSAEDLIDSKIIVYGSGLELIDAWADVHIPKLDESGTEAQ